jgi:hypothetical protein
MSVQALDELKDLEISLESLATGANFKRAEGDHRAFASDCASDLPVLCFNPNWEKYLLVQQLIPGAFLPTKNNELDAGYDLYAFEDKIVPAWGSALISTQISLGLPAGTYGRIASRSGMSINSNIEVGAGVIDRGYTGEIKIVLRNFSDNDYRVARGNKVAQLILEQYTSCLIKHVHDISGIMGQSYRGSAGFGSSGL